MNKKVLSNLITTIFFLVFLIIGSLIFNDYLVVVERDSGLVKMNIKRWDNSDDFTFIGRGNYNSHENGAVGYGPDKNKIETLKRHPKLKKFINWIKKSPPEFYSITYKLNKNKY